MTEPTTGLGRPSGDPTAPADAPDDGTPLPRDRPARRDLYLRLGVLLLLAVSGVLLVRFTPVGELLEGERIIALFESLRGHWWAPLALIGLYVAIAPLGLPASPLLIAGGMVFGFAFGSLYNILGLLAGAMTAFVVGKAVGRDAVLQLGGPRLRRAEAVFQRRGFWPLVQTRFLPIPFAVVSYAAALAGVRASVFFVASLLGLTPATLIHTFFVPALLHAALEKDGERSARLGLTYLAILFAINALVAWPQIRTGLGRRRRYRKLREQRRRR